MTALDCAQVQACFDACFAGRQAYPEDQARLVRGGDEPLFIPAGYHQPIAEVVFARGLVQSCLHEAAHWLFAGRRRRRLTDFGYWYVPDGRNAEQQAIFEQVEIRVQGLEWILSQCAGVQFRVSADNLSSPEPSAEFVQAIANNASQRLQDDLPPRAARFAYALCAESGCSLPNACSANELI